MRKPVAKPPLAQLLHPPTPPPEDADLLQQLRPYVRQTGDVQHAGWRMRPRKLLDYLLLHMVEGCGRFTLRDESFEVTAGDLVWIPPDTVYEMQLLPPKIRHVFVHFDLVYDPQRSHWDLHIPSGMQDLGRWQPLLHPPLPSPRLQALAGRLTLANHVAIGKLLQQISVEHARSGAAACLELSALMLQVVAGILRGSAVPHAAGSRHWELVQGAAGMICQHAENPLSIGHLARQSRLSPSQFRKVFRETVGQSPRSLQRQARIQKTQELLLQSDLNISEIAVQVGFSSVHCLSRAFRELTGQSPLQYRRGNLA